MTTYIDNPIKNFLASKSPILSYECSSIVPRAYGETRSMHGTAQPLQYCNGCAVPCIVDAFNLI